jgi:hypothetical protein
MGITLHLVSALLAATAAAPAAPARVDLKGTVRDAAGSPVQEATVLIYTAQPRKGAGTICPSCYLDCWRRTTTDVQGRFTIEKVDGSLLFRVGAVTPSHEAAFASKVDPLTAEAEIVLKPRPPVPEVPKRVLRGRVVGLDGKQVAHAVISPSGYVRGSSRSFGTVEGIPALTLTGDDGRFTMAAGREIDALVLEVSARGLATTAFEEVPTGLEEQKLELGSGSALKGRVTKDGKPVPGITIGVTQVDRSAGRTVGERTAVTNDEGRFVVANVVPRDLVVLYSKMLDCAPHGALPMKWVETSDHDGVIELGDMAVRPASRLTGRVVLPEGQRVPEDSTLTLFRQPARDFVVVPIAADGTFAFEGVPAEPVNLSVRAAGYRLSRKNVGAGSRGMGLPLAPVERDRELSLILEAGDGRP